MVETMQLEATHDDMEYPSRSAHIDEGTACNKQGTVTRITAIDLSAADSVEALKCTSARIEESTDAHTEDDTAVAMEGEIMGQWEGGVQNRIAGGDAGSTQPRWTKLCQLQGRRHLAATTR